jgi:hypothetical protein
MKYSIIVTLCFVSMASLVLCDSNPIVGGWTENNDDNRAEAERLAGDITSQLFTVNSANPSGEYKLVRVNSFTTQVVAGINYKIDATYQVEVYN